MKLENLLRALKQGRTFGDLVEDWNVIFVDADGVERTVTKVKVRGGKEPRLLIYEKPEPGDIIVAEGTL